MHKHVHHKRTPLRGLLHATCMLHACWICPSLVSPQLHACAVPGPACLLHKTPAECRTPACRHPLNDASQQQGSYESGAQVSPWVGPTCLQRYDCPQVRLTCKHLMPCMHACACCYAHAGCACKPLQMCGSHAHRAPTHGMHADLLRLCVCCIHRSLYARLVILQPGRTSAAVVFDCSFV